MYKIIISALLLAYIIIKYRILGQVEKGPVEGKVLFPRQDARFMHGAMTLLQTIFVLEFISHATRDRGALIRLLVILAIFVSVDLIYWLKVKNFAITYDPSGLTVRDMFGKETPYEWSQVREVRSNGPGMKQAQYFTIRTKDRNIRLSEKSGGLQRFRRFLEERI